MSVFWIRQRPKKLNAAEGRLATKSQSPLYHSEKRSITLQKIVINEACSSLPGILKERIKALGIESDTVYKWKARPEWKRPK